jgi:hypothetical protein
VLTNTGANEQKVLTGIYSMRSFQVRDTGDFRWEANDFGCLVFYRPGPGSVALPFVHEADSDAPRGDTDAFAAPDRVAVEIVEFVGGYCNLVLHDAADGRVLDAVPAQKGEQGERGPHYLDPYGSPHVYLGEPGCPVRLSAGQP